MSLPPPNSPSALPSLSAPGADFGHRATWSHSAGMPFVTNLADLASAPVFQDLPSHHILLNTAAPTALEAANGDWASVAASLHVNAAQSIQDLTTAFDTHLWPSRAQPSTRANHWSTWAVVVTWAVAWGAVHLILPMTSDTLKGLSWELRCMGTPRSVITAIWAAIQHRHKTAGFLPPIQGFGEFSAWTRCLVRLVRRPTALLFPVHRIFVSIMRRWRPAHVRDDQDRLMVALATICCLRVAELVALQVCDLWFDFHAGYAWPFTSPGARTTASSRVTTRPSATQTMRNWT
jgi:hypothetical protein